MSASNPSWYDLIGVAPDASADEIRTAWRLAIAELDPTDRRFGPLNRAAEVLLDPERRAEYDAQLAPEVPEPRQEPEPQPEPEPEPEPTAKANRPDGERRLVPGWLLVGVAVVTLLMAGAAAVVAATVPSDQSVDQASGAARAAAERAIVPILSYDAAHLDESKAAAEAFLTGSYRKEYAKLFDGVIAANAPSTGTVVEGDLVSSGVVRADDDRVQVFLLVNQTRTNKAEKEPVIYKNWVTVTMEKVDGDWLVSGLDT
jgi:Mce-associated membrane protein